MKKVNTIKDNFIYEDLFDTIIYNREVSHFDIAQERYIFVNKNLYDQIQDHVHLIDKYNMWIILSPFKETNKSLNKCKIPFFKYKNLIYGFYKTYKYGIIVIEN